MEGGRIALAVVCGGTRSPLHSSVWAGGTSRGTSSDLDEKSDCCCSTCGYPCVPETKRNNFESSEGLAFVPFLGYN